MNLKTLSRTAMQLTLRTALLFGSVFMLSACREQAQSQQFKDAKPQQVEQTSRDRASINIDQSRQTAITNAVKVVSPAVVSINVTELREYRDPFFNDPFFSQFFRGRTEPQYQEVKSLGSGFLISPDGYIVTNDHVAGNATKITVAFPDGSKREAQLVGTDRITDLALLKVETDKPLPYLSFANSEDVMVGEWVIAFGNPFGLFEATQPTVTVGVVSGLNRNLGPTQGHSYKGMIQTDASINSGNSGGPLMNAIGQVIGVNTVIYTQSGGSVGVGFAVPANKVQEVIGQLKKRGSVTRDVYTGLQVQDMNPYVAQQYGLPSLILVKGVQKNSPAAKAGFQANDVILKINNENVTNQEEAGLQLAGYRVGDKITVTVWREGREVTLNMVLGRLQAQGAM